MQYIDKIYGSFELTGVIEQLINTKAIQRLKKIHQGGAIFLVKPEMSHTRYDHSMGVMLLIRKLGGSIEEQIAGLLHDISHTAFSHLIDYVFELETEDYHEKRYEQVLNDPEIIKILQEYRLTIDTFFDLEKYPMLEYPLPYLCADRIDYTLRDLLKLGVIAIEDLIWFLNGLRIFEGRIVLSSKEHGQWFQEKYEFLISEYFCGKENLEVNVIMKKIIKDCLSHSVLKESDFHKDDFYLIKKMNKAFDLKTRINQIRSTGLDIKELRFKKRRIDPEILIQNHVMNLSEVN